jgi:hypothetical protein
MLIAEFCKTYGATKSMLNAAPNLCYGMAGVCGLSNRETMGSTSTGADWVTMISKQQRILSSDA